jgi:hypothetical protein
VTKNNDAILDKAKAGQKATAKVLEQAARVKKRRNMQSTKAVDPVAFNRWAEEEFVYIVRVELIGENPHTRVQVAEVIKEVAYELKVSPETVKRYIFKHTARRAEFRQHDGWLFLNPNYQPPVDEFEEPDVEEGKDEGEDHE